MSQYFVKTIPTWLFLSSTTRSGQNPHPYLSEIMKLRAYAIARRMYICTGPQHEMKSNVFRTAAILDSPMRFFDFFSKRQKTTKSD